MPPLHLAHRQSPCLGGVHAAGCPQLKPTPPPSSLNDRSGPAGRWRWALQIWVLWRTPSGRQGTTRNVFFRTRRIRETTRMAEETETEGYAGHSVTRRDGRTAFPAAISPSQGFRNHEITLGRQKDDRRETAMGEVMTDEVIPRPRHAYAVKRNISQGRGSKSPSVTRTEPNEARNLIRGLLL